MKLPPPVNSFNRPGPPIPGGESGIALIIVMISIFVLAMLAGGFAYSMKVETRLAMHANNESEIEWLGRSGVEYARWVLAQQLMIPNEPYDALNQVWAGGMGGMGTTNSPLANVQREVQMGNGTFTWKITDLERKMNINTVNEPLLQQALIRLGVDAADVAPVVGSILDWIDTDNNEHLQGAENDFYDGLKPPYHAKNGPIDDLSELLLIKGITPEIYWGGVSSNHPPAVIQRSSLPFAQFDMPTISAGLVDVFTPLSLGKLNINTASSAALQLIPGIEPQVADAIVAARDGEDDGSGLTGPYRNVDQVRRVPGVSLELARALQQFCDVRSYTFEVEVDARVGSSSRKFIATLGRDPRTRKVDVLTFYWK